jgi:prevent-host-death family protein
MRTVGSFEAKTKLAELLVSVEQGEEILITRRGQPVAVLAPPPRRKKPDLKTLIGEMFEVRDRTGPRLGKLGVRELVDEGRGY